MGGSGCQVASRGKSRFRRRSLVIFVYDVYVRRLWADAHSAFPAASLTSSRAFLKRCHSLQPASTPSFVATLIERERGLLISQTTSSQHRCSSLPFVANERDSSRERERERGGIISSLLPRLLRFAPDEVVESRGHDWSRILFNSSKKFEKWKENKLFV